MDRLACISLPSLGLQLVRRRLGLAETEPLAVLAADKPSSPLLQVNRAARAAGLSPGLRYGEALGIVPRLRAGVAHPDDLARARRDLAALAGGFSPRWEPCPFDQGAFWADPSGLEALYGPVEAWGRALVSALAAAGWRAVVVVGFTREGTYVLARARKRSTVVKTPEAEAQSLAAAPLTAFPLGLRSRRLLGRLGVRTWADLGGLAPEDLARRFGPDLTAEVRALRSLRSVPLQTPAAAETLVRRRRFEAPADTLDRLLPGVLEPLGEVLTLLQARGRRLASLTLVLADGEGGLRTEVVTAAEPSAEASLWHRLVALRLEGLAAVPPGLPPTAEVRLAFTDAPLPPFTGELFAPPVVRDLAAGALTLGLVGARWGTEAVVRARLADDHRPEASFRWEPSLGLRTPRPGASGPDPATSVRRVPRLEGQGTGAASGLPLGRPWRLRVTEAGRLVDRDYWFLQTRTGEVHWLSKDRTSGRGRWEGVAD